MSANVALTSQNTAASGVKRTRVSRPSCAFTVRTVPSTAVIIPGRRTVCCAAAAPPVKAIARARAMMSRMDRPATHIGGVTPRPTLTDGASHDPSGCFVARAMKTGAPGLSSLLSPGAKATIDVSGGTITFFSSTLSPCL